MKQVKTRDKMLIVDRIMSIFLWSKIFRAIFALLPPNNFSRAPMHEIQHDLNNDIKDLQNILKIFRMNRNRFRLRWEQSPPNYKREMSLLKLRISLMELGQLCGRVLKRTTWKWFRQLQEHSKGRGKSMEEEQLKTKNSYLKTFVLFPESKKWTSVSKCWFQICIFTSATNANIQHQIQDKQVNLSYCQTWMWRTKSLVMGKVKRKNFILQKIKQNVTFIITLRRPSLNILRRNKDPGNMKNLMYTSLWKATTKSIFLFGKNTIQVNATVCDILKYGYNLSFSYAPIKRWT